MTVSTNGSERPILLRTENLTKRYTRLGQGSEDCLELFRGLNFQLYAGEMLAIVGQSGAGKSSFLHLLAALDPPSGGEIWFGAHRLSQMSRQDAAHYRNREIGYVWQSHYLLPEFTALENTALPLLAGGSGRAAALARAERWLAEVGLASRMKHRPGELSGGEQQRVSLARALVTEPKILLADEPTGNLDEETAEVIFHLMRRLHDSLALSSVLVTHNKEFARRCDRMLLLRNGHLEPASPVETTDQSRPGNG